MRTRTRCRLELADCEASDIRPDCVPRLCKCTSQRRAREAMTESMQEAMEADGAEGWTEMRAVEGTTAAAVVAGRCRRLACVGRRLVHCRQRPEGRP